MAQRSSPPSTGPKTLQQVAEAAGVSLATASRVLHGSGGRVVGEPLRSRVLSAAAELRYVSHAPAQALARSTTSIVGVIVHDIADPYFAAIAAGAMRAARVEDLMVMVANTFRDPDVELDYLARLCGQRARAVVLAGSAFSAASYRRGLDAQIASFEAVGGRVAAVGGQSLPVDAVVPDNRGGGTQVAQHLLDLGHTRIGVVAGPRELVSVAHRLDGFRRGLQAADLVLPPDHVEFGNFTREGGREATAALMARYPDLTAIFALNDLMAIGTLGYLEDQGRRVPEDVSVVGFDDLTVATDVRPALTTVRLDLVAIGEAAMRLVLSEPSERRQRVRMPATLVERATSGPPPARRTRRSRS